MDVTLMIDMEIILTKIGHSLNLGKYIYQFPFRNVHVSPVQSFEYCSDKLLLNFCKGTL